MDGPTGKHLDDGLWVCQQQNELPVRVWIQQNLSGIKITIFH